MIKKNKQVPCLWTFLYMLVNKHQQKFPQLSSTGGRGGEREVSDLLTFFKRSKPLILYEQNQKIYSSVTKRDREIFLTAFKSLNYNLFFTSAIFCTFELLLFGPTLTLKNKNCLKNTQLDHLGHCQPQEICLS